MKRREIDEVKVNTKERDMLKRPKNLRMERILDLLIKRKTKSQVDIHIV
jgi:hypothetical protein